MPTLTHRPLTDLEAELLHRELKSTPNILGYTIGELRRLTDVQVAEQEARFAGVCFSVDLRGKWTEIAALYVLPEFRGLGLGERLFEAASRRAQERRRHVYVLSRNPQVIAWMREAGMTIDTQHWRAPPAVHWYLLGYMASRYRIAESVRKRKAMRDCPALVQGIKKAAKEQAE